MHIKANYTVHMKKVDHGEHCRYNTVNLTIHNGCGRCRGTGMVWYSTEEDLAAFVPPPDNVCPRYEDMYPKCSASKECEECAGSGLASVPRDSEIMKLTEEAINSWLDNYDGKDELIAWKRACPM